jgi:hypothetical protein
MKITWTPILALSSAIFVFHLQAGPQTDSWFTNFAGQYARVYTNDAMKAAGTALTTWSNGSQTQALPAYCGVQAVYSSTRWVYVRSTGLASYNMGPWYLNAQRTTIFPNLPVNQQNFFRFPQTSSVPTTKTETGGGQIGIFVDGVAMFNSWDAYYWNGTEDVSGGGTGYWNRDAYVNEGVTFDAAYAHQQNTGTYHYHADPVGLRYLLGDHVNFSGGVYSESTNTPTQHSPILAWTADGFPLYGPYGYSSASNSTSGIRRMVSGYVIRNGEYGTSNLTANGRATIPQWAVRLFNVSSNQTGPAVSTSYPLGRYMEDNDYLGDRGHTQGVDFDLDEYNGRWCVTPEFPNGTYAYFVAISSNGAPVYPYNIGRGYYGSPTGGTVTSISETVATNFLGETNLVQKLNNPSIDNYTVTLSWSALEGGSYQVQRSTNLATWTVLASGVSPNQTAGSYTNVTALSQNFYRVSRTSVASFQSATATSVAPGTVEPASASPGTTVTVTMGLPANPPDPPSGAPISSVTLAGSISGSNISDSAQGTVVATFVIPPNAAIGAQNIVISFESGPTYTLDGVLTIN